MQTLYTYAGEFRSLKVLIAAQYNGIKLVSIIASAYGHLEECASTSRAEGRTGSCDIHCICARHTAHRGYLATTYAGQACL